MRETPDRRIYLHRYYLSHRSHIRKQDRARYLRNRADPKRIGAIHAKGKRSSGRYRHRHPERIVALRRDYYRRNRSRIRERVTQWLVKLKREVLAHYSPSMRCQRCGFKDIRALSIDHVNGSGSRHMRAIHRRNGAGLYFWLKKNHFPPGFQVLCMNCQFVKRAERREYGNG